MGNFALRFLMCNLFISIIIGLLLAAKRIFRKKLTSRMQYNLWFPLLGLLAIPFLPVRPLPFFSWSAVFQTMAGAHIGALPDGNTAPVGAGALDWMNDFGVAVSQKTSSRIGSLLFVLWAAGMAGMVLLTARSALRFRALKKSSLPLQDPGVRRIYQGCLREMNIRRKIPVYSTAYLKSPVISGMFRPCIYMPIHLISDHNAKDLRYMLLHELSHYRHRDAVMNHLMNIANVLYWFNPAVWLACREMKTDREIACDTSVLRMLGADDHESYGHTLIDLAEKISHSPFPFATGMSGSMAQMQRRIINIATYQKESFQKSVSSFLAYILIAAFLAGFIPVLSIHAADRGRYAFQEQGRNITYLDLDDSFGENEGSFVLYDAENDSWQIYNKECAVTRIAPVSTYKIYSALFGLEAGIISPEQSLLEWDRQHYAYEAWNSDQTLQSAMQDSVTWYFQAIDRQAGFPAIRDYIAEIEYGNQTVRGDISSYWADSTLGISPIEQVEMLQRFYYNQFGFSPENISAVKDSIYLYSEGNSRIYGKTGTGEINGTNTLGWFVGYIEQEGHTCFFATSIRNDNLATGSIAAELTRSILKQLHYSQT